jgi:hypothetical protein
LLENINLVSNVNLFYGTDKNLAWFTKKEYYNKEKLRSSIVELNSIIFGKVLIVTEYDSQGFEKKSETLFEKDSSLNRVEILEYRSLDQKNNWTKRLV